MRNYKLLKKDRAPRSYWFQ